jgi:hypothetical protein
MVPFRETEADVLVCGGGTAGVSAALSAAFNGMSVRILELNGFFGGTLVSGLVGGFCGIFGAKHSPDDEPPLVVGGTGRQVMDAVSSLGGLSGLCRSPLFNTLRYDSCLLQIALDRLLLRAGVRLSLYTAITDAGAEDGRVVYVDTWSKSGRERIFPRIVIDATGDADLVWMTGGRYRKDAALLQPASFNFRVGGVDPSLGAVPDFPTLSREIARARERDPELCFSREDPMFLQAPIFERETVCGFSRIPADGTDVDSLTAATLAGRAEVLPTLGFIKSHFPAFRYAHLSGLASHLGIRETRVIEGEETLTTDDVISGRRRADGIGRCAWPIERHISGRPKAKLVPVSGGDWYDLPYGMILPQGYQNLFVIGRAAAADREASASSRVFGPCSVMGQAAGTAAALALEGNLASVRDVDLPTLRGCLQDQGAII